MGISPDEICLVGHWIVAGDKVRGDAACERIVELLSSTLKFVRADASGWDKLYRDPADGRYWELTYPYSEMHGGGPPQLCFLSAEAASRKYGSLEETGSA